MMNSGYGYDGYNGYAPPQDQYRQRGQLGYPQAGQANTQLMLYDVIGKNTGIDWVQGEFAAKSYRVPPGMSMILFDMDVPNRVYIKAVNSAGVPIYTSGFDLGQVELGRPVEVPDEKKYITREEHDRSMRKIAEMLARISGGKDETNEHRTETARMGNGEPERVPERATERTAERQAEPAGYNDAGTGFPGI